MPITVNTQVTEVIEQRVEKALTVQVLQFTVRANGPDAGEIFGVSQALDGERVVAQWDWVVPASDALPVAMKKVGAKTLYAALTEALYSFAVVVRLPQERA